MHREPAVDGVDIDHWLVDTARMDERLAALDRRVAAAADAWLADPRDIGVYGRLVAAIEVRRAYLNPPLDEDPREVESVAVLPAAEQEDEVLDELADTGAPIRPIGEVLRGDPAAVLARLREQS